MDLYFDYDYNDPDNAWAHRPAPDQVQRFLKQKVLIPAAISGQEATDWIIDVDADPTPAWCGTGGCNLQIWTADDQGAYRKVFDQQVRDWKLKRIKGERRPWLWVDLHGSACTSFGADACPFAFEWNRQGRFSASARFASTPTVRPGPLPQPTDFDEERADAPKDLLALADRQQEVCVNAGGDLNGAFRIVNRIPDLNGDGIDDWSFDNAHSYCTFGDDVDFLKSHAFDACARLDCVDQLFLSRQTSQGIHWERISLGTEGYVFRISTSGFQLFRLIPLQGHGAEATEACGAALPDYCQLSPVAISPDE